jgi:hypothetical protein
MDGYISELKNTRKQLHADLEDQLGDWRRKTLKLETENAQLKCRIEAAQTLNQQSNRRCSFDRDSSVDSDHGLFACPSLSERTDIKDISGGERYGSNSAMSRSYNGRYPFNNSAGGGSAYSGSLNRRRKTCGELPERQNNLCRSSSNISALADTGSLSRHGATNNVMTTSFTTTVDSGLLTRCSSSASTTDSQLNLRQNGSSSCSSYLQMGHRLNDSERKSQKLEREIHTLRQDFQLIKRELDVYKHSLQDSERVILMFSKIFAFNRTKFSKKKH